MVMRALTNGKPRSFGALLLITALVSVSGCGSSGRAIVDLFWTPDQRGRWAFEHRDFPVAADTFEDPMWRGVSAYRAGRYAEAANAFARVASADGLFNMGNSLVKGREYARAVPVYEQALAEDPQHEGARNNLEVAKAIIAYLDEARQAGGTEVGADEYRYDNTRGEGQDTVVPPQEGLAVQSAEQWMRTVDTQSTDFLRTRFALEAANRGAQ